jgi:hypothetical protein
MKNTIFSLLFLLILFISCHNDRQIGNSDQNAPIKEYIKKFSILDLPFFFKGYGNYIDQKKLFKIDVKSVDSLFFKGENDDELYGYGLLADTSKFYPIIYFAQGEDMYPILVTYSKTGEFISKETLIVNGCGPDCGLTYCSYTALIKKDLSIYLADTTIYKGICDSIGNFLPNSNSTFVNSKIGLVNPKGKILIEPELIKKTKNSP